MSKKAVVTGGAGFVGTSLTERLLLDGWSVVAIDAFTDYYNPALKHANVRPFLGHERYALVQADLLDPKFNLGAALEDAEVIFHQAGQPGVRGSWSDGFPDYVSRNILASQRLLETIRASTHKPRVVYASSSSVYGHAEVWPCTEDTVPRPFSPYGVTKLSAEHLFKLYAENFGLETTSLRYFTVYGPRQRPDMAFNRFFKAALSGRSIPLYGDGSQRRDFTFVEDVVEANILAAEQPGRGEVYNIAGGSSISIREVLKIISSLVGEEILIEHLPRPAGDVVRTGGGREKAGRMLGWQPRVGIEEGLARQLTWQVEVESVHV